MRFIEDLRNKHLGEEIWILGTGPSLDDYPKDFFKNKITIALKYAVAAFPHHTYSMCKTKSLKMSTFLKKYPRLFKTHIFLYPKSIPKYKEDPILMRARKCRHPMTERAHLKICGAIDKTKQEIPISENIRGKTYYASDSVSHWAMQTAYILGAKRITLVGCEDKCRKYGCWAKRVSWFYYKSYKVGKQIRKAGHEVPPDGYSAQQIKAHWKARNHAEARQVTRWLAEALKQHGIEAALYHCKKTSQYKKGYLKLA